MTPADQQMCSKRRAIRRPTWWCLQLPSFPVSGARGHASPPPGSQWPASSAPCSAQSPEEWRQSHYRRMRPGEAEGSRGNDRTTCTCGCLDTQWRSTFKTLLVAALLITNSLSPFRWSVGKPGTRKKMFILASFCTKKNSFFILQTPLKCPSLSKVYFFKRYWQLHLEACNV